MFLINQFGLVIEYRKSKVFHLSSLSPLNLSPLRGPTLCLKDNWKYLDFIFDKKLLFQQHVDFYANKALSTIKCMKMLGNFNIDHMFSL